MLQHDIVLVVVFGAEVGDELLAHHPAQSVFELHRLDEEVVLGIQLRRAHGRFEVEAEPLLNAMHSGALGQVEEEDEVEHDGRGENGVAAEKIHFDLHGIAEPAENVDIVPAFFVVAARRVIVDADLVVEIAVEFGIELRLQNIFERAEFGFLFGFERARVVEDFAVAIAENVGGEPAVEAEHARFESRRENGFHERLAGFEIFAAKGNAFVVRKLDKRGKFSGEIGCTVGEGHAFLNGGVGVEHGRRNGFVIFLHGAFERGERFVDFFGLEENFGGGAPDHHGAVDFGGFFEVANVFAKLFGEIEFVFCALDVFAVEIFDVGLVERGFHGFDFAEEGLNFAEMIRVEDARFGGGFVRGVRENVPAAENEIVEAGERNEVLNFRRAAFGALAETDGSHLRERADREGVAVANQFDAGHKSGADRADAGREYAELAFGLRDLSGFLHSNLLSRMKFRRESRTKRKSACQENKHDARSGMDLQFVSAKMRRRASRRNISEKAERE